MTERDNPTEQPEAPIPEAEQPDIPDGDFLLRDGKNREIKVIHTPCAEKSHGVVIRKLDDENGLETEVHPWAEVEELPDASGRGRFALRLFNKAKEVVHDAEEAIHEHPKAATFTAAGVIAGVGTTIVFLKKKS